MDVFALRDLIVSEYQKFATSFTTIHAEDIRAQVEAIYAEGRFWPDPLLQINPSYKKGLGIETLIASGALDPRTAEIFRSDGAPLALYKHQEQAVVLAAQGEFLILVDNVCRVMPGFQVFITTTTPPPAVLASRVALQLSRKDLLLKRRIENLLARATVSSTDTTEKEEP